MSKYKPKEEWDTGTAKPCADECSYAEDHLDYMTTVFIPLGISKVIKALDRKFPHAEWQMLLCGSRTSSDRVVITDYRIPKQEVGAATVTNLDCIDKDYIEEHNVIATMHSHVNMGTSPSHTDKEKTNKSQIDLHIIVNHRGNYTALEKVSLPCGLVTFIDAEVEWEEVAEEDTNIVGLENISECEYKYPVAGSKLASTHWDTSGEVSLDALEPDWKNRQHALSHANYLHFD